MLKHKTTTSTTTTTTSSPTTLHISSVNDLIPGDSRIWFFKHCRHAEDRWRQISILTILEFCPVMLAWPLCRAEYWEQNPSPFEERLVRGQLYLPHPARLPICKHIAYWCGHNTVYDPTGGTYRAWICILVSFLAVQDSSIGDLVTDSMTHWLSDTPFDFRDFWENFEWLLRDFWETFERLFETFEGH